MRSRETTVESRLTTVQVRDLRTAAETYQLHRCLRETSEIPCRKACRSARRAAGSTKALERCLEAHLIDVLATRAIIPVAINVVEHHAHAPVEVPVHAEGEVFHATAFDVAGVQVKLRESRGDLPCTPAGTLALNNCCGAKVSPQLFGPEMQI